MGCNCGNKAKPSNQSFEYTSADGKVKKVVRSEIEAKALKARAGGTGTYAPLAAR